MKLLSEKLKLGILVRKKWSFKDSGIVKLAKKSIPNLEYLRVVEIPDVDTQLCEEPHVKNTIEIGEVQLIKVESKGKRRRMYYTIKT